MMPRYLGVNLGPTSVPSLRMEAHMKTMTQGVVKVVGFALVFAAPGSKIYIFAAKKLPDGTLMAPSVRVGRDGLMPPM
jgi:hypothetical protein